MVSSVTISTDISTSINCTAIQTCVYLVKFCMVSSLTISTDISTSINCTAIQICVYLVSVVRLAV